MNTQFDKLLAAVILSFGLLMFSRSILMETESPEQLTPCPVMSVDVLSDCIAAHRADVINYSQLVNDTTQVLVFGEGHLADAHRNELIGALAKLKTLGFTRLALEAMPSSRQHLISDYKLGRLSRAELVQEISDLWGQSPQSYVRLIDAALSEGLEVVFLDNDRERVDLSASNWRELEREARNRREIHWLEELTALFVSDSKAKVIVLVGASHISLTAVTLPVQARLALRNITTQTIEIEGGDMFYDDTFTRAARLAMLQKTRFIVNTVSGEPGKQVDYHLHLPQTDDPKRIISVGD
jgi:hypothetical protein